MATEVGNVPAQPVYGEVQEIEAQEAAAPFPAETQPPSTDAVGSPVIADQGPVQGPTEQMPEGVGQTSPNNIASVLPPSDTAPAVTGQRPLGPAQQLAFVIMGTPGMSPITRSFAQQIIGRYRAENRLPEMNLTKGALNQYRARAVQSQLPESGEETEE